jgi:retron-type reverse transcriptase
MGFWDGIKRLFGLGAGSSRRPESPFEQKIDRVVRERIAARRSFGDREIADEVLDRPTTHNLQVTIAIVERQFRDDVLAPLGFMRTRRPAFGGTWVFHPVGTAPPSPTPPRSAATGAQPGPPGVSIGAPAQPAPSAPNPYLAPDILGLSAEELRKRALRISPWRTGWIGRVDTIPPQSDERTAIIDRGIILRGLLTEEQVVEIHRVGDLWLKHHDAVKMAEALARTAGEQAVEEERKRKAEIKAQKKKDSAERKERRAREIAQRKAEDIVFLGAGVSGFLGDRRSLVELLQSRGLPVLSSPADVARALQISVPRLRWLAFHTEAATRSHYVYFEVPKRAGGTRLLSAPHESLAAAQEWILHEILEKLTFEEPAHGFIKGRSTVTNATPHLGRDVVVNLDLQDFFPSITFPRIRGLFRKLGYSPAASTVLALLCTESPRRLVEYDGQSYWVAVGPRSLPQGACTSPALSNLVTRKLDRRLRGMSARAGWTYTRYADDLTLSAPAGKREQVGRLIARVRHLAADEGFTLHPRKGRVQRTGGRQSVTGIVVNDKLSLPRHEVRRLRAMLHGARKAGLEAQNREARPHFEAWLRGKLAYLAMIDRDRGLTMLRQLDGLTRR